MKMILYICKIKFKTKMKKDYYLTLILLISLSLFSCQNEIIPENANEKATLSLSPKQLGEIHNRILNKLMVKYEQKKINGLKDLLKTETEITSTELAKYGITYTKKDVTYSSKLLKEFGKKILNSREEGLNFLIDKTNYPQYIKSKLHNSISTHPEINSFIKQIDNFSNIQTRSNSNNLELSNSLEILKEIALASNNYWNKRPKTKGGSFASYLADGLGGASFLWDKAMEPCLKQDIKE